MARQSWIIKNGSCILIYRFLCIVIYRSHMFELVRKNALDFASNYRNQCTSLGAATQLLEEALRSFGLNRTKLDFLATVRVQVEKQKHVDTIKQKTKPAKYLFPYFENALFALDQEMEKLSVIQGKETIVNDPFTAKEMAHLIECLTNITEELNEGKLRQTIALDALEKLQDDFDELKEHLQLGKKNWGQLLKGKVMDAVYTGVLTKENAENLVRRISDMVSGKISLLS